MYKMHWFSIVIAALQRTFISYKSHRYLKNVLEYLSLRLIVFEARKELSCFPSCCLCLYSAT